MQKLHGCVVRSTRFVSLLFFSLFNFRVELCSGKGAVYIFTDFGLVDCLKQIVFHVFPHLQHTQSIVRKELHYDRVVKVMTVMDHHKLCANGKHIAVQSITLRMFMCTFRKLYGSGPASPSNLAILIMVDYLDQTKAWSNCARQ